MSTHQLAMVGQLARTLQHRVRTTGDSNNLTTQAATGTTAGPSGRTGQTGRFPMPTRLHCLRILGDQLRILQRWIEAQAVALEVVPGLVEVEVAVPRLMPALR
jgi:hypothetical protein